MSVTIKNVRFRINITNNNEYKTAPSNIHVLSRNHGEKLISESASVLTTMAITIEANSHGVRLRKKRADEALISRQASVVVTK